MDFYFSPTGLQDLSEVLCSTDRILLGVETPNSTDGISRGGENVAETWKGSFFKESREGYPNLRRNHSILGPHLFISYHVTII